MAEIKITEKNFEQEVLQAKEPVLVDFWASWCGPCRMLGPVLSEVAKENEGRVKVGKVNVDDEGGLAMRFGVSAIPTVILFKNGVPVKQMVGFKSKRELEAMIS